MRFALVLGALLVGCVDDAVLVGDVRAERACEDGIDIVVPPLECTPVTVRSSSPYGCLDESTGEDHAGTWVRIANPHQVEATVRIRPVSSGCAIDGGTCPISATLRSIAGTPCACRAGTTTTFPLTSEITIPIDGDTAEILLEPLGATFEVTLCAPTH